MIFLELITNPYPYDILNRFYTLNICCSIRDVYLELGRI